MKIDLFETDDRYKSLQKKADTLAEGAEDCLKKNTLSLMLQEHSPYIYIFAFPKTADDGVTKKMFWQPRLTKPKAQTNSYLFRALSYSDELEIIWMLPPREQLDNFQKGKLLESDEVIYSYDMFDTQREKLEAPDPNDLPDSKIEQIYRMIDAQVKEQKRINKLYDRLYATPTEWVDFASSQPLV